VPLPSFAPPGHLEDLANDGRASWGALVAAIFANFTPAFPQFADPRTVEFPVGSELNVQWSAFPATQRSGTLQQRWARVDADRGLQDEYCEWSVERTPAGDIAAVTFTTETPEYYGHLLATEEDKALDLYEQMAGDRPTANDLRDGDAKYVAANAFNAAADGPIVHLSQPSNTLGAAVRLAAEATILRERNGFPVVDPQSLVRCGGLGEPLRNSDPQIAAAVNNFAAQGMDVSLADPIGLYLSGVITNGMRTPDGANPATFWTVERGTPEFALRARFAVPDELGYTVSQITLGGRPITFGGQIAQGVGVRLRALARPAEHQADRQGCVR
jgi:hypothetical protein